MGKYSQRRGKFNWVAFSKGKKYKIIMFSGIALALICIAVGLFLFSQVSKTTLPRDLMLHTMSNAIPVAGKENEYNVKLTQEETIIIMTGTKEQALATPITFNRVGGCVDLVEAVAPMYYEGHTTIKPKMDAPNHTTGDLIISCGSEKSITLHIEIYWDDAE